MRIRVENLVASVRVLTGAFAFFIWIIVGSLLLTDPLILALCGIAVFLLFHIMGGVFARLIERTNHEITDVDRDKAGEAMKERRRLGRILDISQSAELPHQR